MAASLGGGGPILLRGQRVVVLPDPVTATEQLEATNTTLAHLDEASDRLIVAWPLAAEQQTAAAEAGGFVFVLVTQPGDALFVRAFQVETVQQPVAESGLASGWLVLRGAGGWQRIDRRRAERVVVPSAQLDGRRYPVTGGSIRLEGHVRDMSEGGMLLETEQRLGLGDGVEFDLPLLAGAPTLRARARVLRVQQATPPQSGWLVGCRFEGLTPDEHARLEEFVVRREVVATETFDPRA